VTQFLGVTLDSSVGSERRLRPDFAASYFRCPRQLEAGCVLPSGKI